MVEPLTCDALAAMDNAIAKDDAAAIHTLAAQEPRLLIFSGDKPEVGASQYFPYPLTNALLADRLHAAEAILQELRDRAAELQRLAADPKNRIDPHCEERIGLSPLLYVDQPHTQAMTPEALRLLERYGYDFTGKSWPFAQSALGAAVQRFAPNQEFPQSLARFKAMVKTIMELSPEDDRMVIDHAPDEFNQDSLKCSQIVQYAFNHLCRSPSPHALEALECLAEAGADFREYRRKSPKKLGYATPPRVLDLENLHHRFRNMAIVSVEEFSGASPERRAQIARIAASTGDMPKLLLRCIREEDVQAVTEITAALTDRWRGEYRHSLRNAANTLARCAAVENPESQLGLYLSDSHTPPAR